MSSLGEKLRDAKLAADRAAAEKAERERARKAAAQQEYRDNIQKAFDKIRQQVIRMIEEDHATDIRIKVPASFHYYENSRYSGSTEILISNPSHDSHDIWVSESEWYNSNDLAIKLVYEHDGMGMQSWYVLHVTPILG